jgi:hypothetical protein
MLVMAVIGAGETSFAVLFQSFLAAIAVLAGIDHATDTSYLAFDETGNSRAYLRDSTDDLMAGYQGINGAAPLIADCMQVRMADPAVQNFDLYIVRARITSLKMNELEWLVGAGGPVTD